MQDGGDAGRRSSSGGVDAASAPPPPASHGAERVAMQPHDRAQGEWPTAAGGVSLPQLRAPVQDHQLQHQPMELGGSGGGGGPPPGWHSPWHNLPGGLSGLQRSPTQDAAGGLAALYGQLSGGAQQQLLAQSAYSSCFASSGGCGGSTGSFGALAGGGVGGSGLDSGGGRPPLPRFSSTRRSAPAELQHEIQRGGSASCGSGCGLFSVSADPATGVMADWGAAYAPPAGQRGSAVDAAALRLQHSPQGRRAALSPLAGLGAGGLGSDGFDGSGSLGSSGGGGSGGLALLGARPAQPDSWTHYSGMDAGLSGLGLTGSGLSTHSMPTSFLSPLLFELGTQRPSDGQYQAASQLEHVVGESSWPLAGGADADCVGFLPPAGFGLVGRAGSMPGAGFGSGPSGAAGGSQGLPPLPLIAVRRRTASGCLLGDVAWGGGAASGERSVRASPPPARPQQRLGRRKSGRHAASSSDSDADWRPEAEEGSGGSGGLLDGGFGSGRGGMGGGNAMPPAPGLTRRTSWHATAAEAMAAAEAAALNPGDRPKVGRPRKDVSGDACADASGASAEEGRPKKGGRTKYASNAEALARRRERNRASALEAYYRGKARRTELEAQLRALREEDAALKAVAALAQADVETGAKVRMLLVAGVSAAEVARRLRLGQ